MKEELSLGLCPIVDALVWAVYPFELVCEVTDESEMNLPGLGDHRRCLGYTGDLGGHMVHRNDHNRVVQDKMVGFGSTAPGTVGTGHVDAV